MGVGVRIGVLVGIGVLLGIGVREGIGVLVGITVTVIFCVGTIVIVIETSWFGTVGSRVGRSVGFRTGVGVGEIVEARCGGEDDIR